MNSTVCRLCMLTVDVNLLISFIFGDCVIEANSCSSFYIIAVLMCVLNMYTCVYQCVLLILYHIYITLISHRTYF